MRSLARIIGSTGLAFAIAAWASAGGPPQPQSFVDFCAYVGSNFTGGHWLGAFCRNNLTEVFGYNYSWIDLDLCVGNNASKLVPYNKGNYSTSCKRCKTSHDKKTLTLTCDCKNSKNGYSKSSLDLNTAIYDDNGSVGCFGHLGNKSVSP
ncbi:hypothetical protein C8A05DRAFT_11411 [Staphylotrichum tortipilum]|uniref:Cyanovirin-N domain-containing protein n=1 Tax=Staphylotrichum tortipilum TaxID=2831512 RepID=A0AAN6RXX0_9PEZI|nr:hypothetical protein C8A05DRAFT_11411 [Staphylotrichum longicolle]